VLRDIRRTARANEVEAIATATAVAGQAVGEGDLDRALELLVWARGRAPRSTAIREGLGVARYLAGDFEEAQRELLAYRRMSGRPDQNHLLADAARAVGRPERVVDLVAEMAAAHAEGDLPTERLVEGLLVHAGVRADAGDHEGALALLERAPLPDLLGEAHARTWYAMGDLAAAMGDDDLAREYFDAVTTVDEDFLDVRDRLQALGGPLG
jgi:tetratricopeptide (TPR) repeat protein